MNTKMLHGRTELAYQRSIMAKLDNQLKKDAAFEKRQKKYKAARKECDEKE